MGRTDPSAAVISLICREFNVSEAWLRTGEGEPFQPLSPDDELSQVFSAIAASDDELIKRIIRAYWKLDDREKAAVKKLIDGFSVGGSGTLPVDTGQQQEARAPQEMTDAELHAELDRQLIGEDPEIAAVLRVQAGAAIFVTNQGVVFVPVHRAPAVFCGLAVRFRLAVCLVNRDTGNRCYNVADFVFLLHGESPLIFCAVRLRFVVRLSLYAQYTPFQ